VVGGYRADAIDTSGLKLEVNERHEETGELESLRRALPAITRDTVVSYGDLMLRGYILRDLLDVKADFAVVVDSSAVTDEDAGRTNDFVQCSEPDDRSLFGRQVLLRRVTNEAADSDGRWIGMLAVRGEGVARLTAMMERLVQRPDFDRLDMPDLLNALVDAGETVEVLYVHGHWRGINDLYDFDRAGEFARP
jgi:phosphoenolpyruvate phosphomutase